MKRCQSFAFHPCVSGWYTGRNVKAVKGFPALRQIETASGVQARTGLHAGHEPLFQLCNTIIVCVTYLYDQIPAQHADLNA